MSLTIRAACGEPHIAIIGQGYVGLPLAVEFGKHHDTLGFDIDARRIAELQGGYDHTLETTSAELKGSPHLRFSADASALTDRDVYIVTVPTPVDAQTHPDLRPLQSACELLSGVLVPGDLVVFESTVYPGTTEEVCVPLLEQGSGLRFNVDFYCGYSPERINPGDHRHRLPEIRKITSGSTPEAADVVDALYARIVTAGTWKAPSMRVAEAAKVIENIQRDVNIALVNELAVIFDRLDIDTGEVLAAAATKWNFLPFRPGLVGGHCIGVDPYYLLHKSESVGYHPELIHTARKVNNRISGYVAGKVMAGLRTRDIVPATARVLVLGATFKENCPDMRNSRALDLARQIAATVAAVDVCDPWAADDALDNEPSLHRIETPSSGDYDAVVLAVVHDQYRAYDVDQIRALGRPGAYVYDVKSAWPREAIDERL